MRRLAIILLVFAIFLIACDLNPQPSSDTNNPGNLNTPNPNNPSQDINTATAPTPLAPEVGTPVGDAPGPGTPTVGTINDAGTPVLFTPTLPPTAAPSSTP